jgi:hypothetical protein
MAEVITLKQVPWDIGRSVDAYPRVSDQVNDDLPPTGVGVVQAAPVNADQTLTYTLEPGFYWAVAPITSGGRDYRYVADRVRWGRPAWPVRRVRPARPVRRVSLARREPAARRAQRVYRDVMAIPERPARKDPRGSRATPATPEARLDPRVLPVPRDQRDRRASPAPLDRRVLRAIQARRALRG